MTEPTPPAPGALRLAKIVIVIACIGAFGRGAAEVYPLLSWPMYHTRGEDPPPVQFSEIEVRVLGPGGKAIGTIKASDVFGFERVPGGAAYLNDTFVSTGDDIDAGRQERIEFLSKRAQDLLGRRDIEALEAWRVTWNVAVGSVPPVERDEPTAEEQIDRVGVIAAEDTDT